MNNNESKIADNYLLLKPFSPYVLLRKIRDILDTAF